MRKVVRIMGGKLWTKEETEYVKKNYAVLGSKPCAAYIGRGYQAVQKKAEELGIKKWYSNTYIDADGYWVYRANRNDSAQRVHRIIMEKVLGRKLTSDEVVHHIDENKLNNDISNLQVMTRAEHAEHHRIKLVEAQNSRYSLG